MAGQEGELPRKKHFYYDSRKKEKAPSGSSELPAAPTAPVPPDSLVSIFSSLCMTEGQSLSQPKAKPGSDGASQAAPSRPPTTNVINAPQNPTGPDGDIAEKAGGDPGQSGASASTSASVSASTSRPSVPSASIMAAPKKRTIQRFLEDQSASAEKPAVGPAETPNANSQQTRLNRDSAKMFLKSIKKELLESKNQKKFWKKKMAATHLKMCLLKNAYKTVVLRKKSKLASEKLAMWIQLKANDILRKYGNRGPGVRRNRQSKTVLIRKQLRKKKMVAKKIKEAKKAAEEARSRLSLSISPAVPAEPQPSTAAGPAELPASLPEAAGRKRYRKQYYRRKKLLPVREYDLRSSSSFSSSDRMVTRLASKSKQ